MAGARPRGPQGYRQQHGAALLPNPFSPSGFRLRRFFLTLFLLAALTALGAGAWGLWWVHRPLDLPAANVDLSVEPGTTPRGVAEAVAATGTRVQPQLLYAWFRFSGQDRQIRAGSYELERGVTPRTLLNMLVRGEEATRSLVLVEGWNFRQVRAALAKHEKIVQTLSGLSDSDVMDKLGHPGVFPEGRFFPDTYRFVRGMTDVEFLKKAYNRLDDVLAQEWSKRAADAPYTDPYQALIMASLVEKETGVPEERGPGAASARPRSKCALGPEALRRGPAGARDRAGRPAQAALDHRGRRAGAARP